MLNRDIPAWIIRIQRSPPLIPGRFKKVSLMAKAC